MDQFTQPGLEVSTLYKTKSIGYYVHVYLGKKELFVFISSF